MATPQGSNKPSGTAFKQQKLKAWQPILTPKWIICAFAVIGILFIPIGVVLKVTADGVVEYRVQYGGTGTTCESKVQGGSQICNIDFAVEKMMKKPVFVYYELANFYQNHRRYVKSRSDAQLIAKDSAFDDDSLKSSCDPEASFKNDEDGKIYWPCGLIANSFFNDNITLDSESLSMDETGIAWDSDRTMKFKNPSEEKIAEGKGKYQYIWDTFSTIRAPYSSSSSSSSSSSEKAAGGVEDEHFIVWMRTAGLPTFRKLYGRIDADIEPNTSVKFSIDSSFEVDSFNGKKFIVISTGSWLGGRNQFLGIAYIAVGTLCLCFSLLFFVKHHVSPRRLGDTRYLVWKNR